MCKTRLHRFLAALLLFALLAGILAVPAGADSLIETYMSGLSKPFDLPDLSEYLSKVTDAELARLCSYWDKAVDLQLANKGLARSLFLDKLNGRNEWIESGSTLRKYPLLPEYDPLRKVGIRQLYSEVLYSGLSYVVIVDNNDHALVIFGGTNCGKDDGDILADIQLSVGKSSTQASHANAMIRDMPYKNITVTGHSLGGYLATSVALHHDTVKKCVTFDPPGRHDVAEWKKKGVTGKIKTYEAKGSRISNTFGAGINVVSLTVKENGGIIDHNHGIKEIIDAIEQKYGSIASAWPAPKASFSSSGLNYPSALKVGDYFSLVGTVSCTQKITSLTAGVYNASSGGNLCTGKTVSPNSTSYNIKNIDKDVRFNVLSAGTYYYRITASASDGTTKQLLNQKFTVTAKKSTSSPSPAPVPAPTPTPAPAPTPTPTPAPAPAPAASSSYGSLNFYWVMDSTAYTDKSAFDFGSVDVYINGSLAAQDVYSYCSALPAGTTYSLIVKPAAGFTFVGSSVPLNGVINTSNILIQLQMARGDAAGPRLFYDVDPNAWYADAVEFVVERKIMSGYGNGAFAPNDLLSRAMIVQMLYNSRGKPRVVGKSPFSDVAGTEWFSDAVRWGERTRIISGFGDGQFKPNDSLSIEQLATILYNHSGLPSLRNRFYNLPNHSDWATIPLSWASDVNLFSGIPFVSATDRVTRAQAAKALMNYMK